MEQCDWSECYKHGTVSATGTRLDRSVVIHVSNVLRVGKGTVLNKQCTRAAIMTERRHSIRNLLTCYRYTNHACSDLLCIGRGPLSLIYTSSFPSWLVVLSIVYYFSFLDSYVCILLLSHPRPLYIFVCSGELLCLL